MKRYGLIYVPGETHAESYYVIGRMENGDYVRAEDALDMREALRDLLAQAKGHIAYPCEEIERAEELLAKGEDI